MDKKLKSRWVKALESGKFRRAKGQLKNDSGYCCLGVLCKVARVEFEPKETYLPKSLASMAGISAAVQTYLAAANDGDLIDDEDIAEFPRYQSNKGASFKSIAAYIRKHL